MVLYDILMCEWIDRFIGREIKDDEYVFYLFINKYNDF